ncbi:ATP-binding protein [Rubrivivax gelatinosus]|uniref:Serine/threonine-protein kinase RsbT n=1 Tax=Rubrivivax gelatinosus TaxID=28068 RepID=A0A4R2MTN0_RUBGE|nr:ATP-binding protein [Rubrivivax gelatinosus]MBK1688822.1 anti-sigma regulatory factor [Rubrivivax gelatinosus]TCP02853.1 serine/threonine-protein kinase RsbT [Rubrivivax gelatinosus]
MLELRSGEDIVRARLAARDLVRQVGLGVMDQTRFATAVSELGRNAVRYAVQARCELADLSDARHWRLQAMISDQGPGIRDLDLAMQDGYSTGGSLGAGLPGARRLVDVFDIRSDGSGTVVTVQLVRPRRP